MKEELKNVELTGFVQEKFEEYQKKITLHPTKGKPVKKEAKYLEIEEIRE